MMRHGSHGLLSRMSLLALVGCVACSIALAAAVPGGRGAG